MGQREDLMAGARTCLVEKGYHRTTARDIATASGAHLASIGYHYGSKDGLMSAAVLEAQGEWGDAVDAAVLAAGKVSPSRRLQVCIDELIKAMDGQRAVLIASVQAYAQAAFAEEIRSMIAAATAGARRDLAAMVLGRPVEEIDDATAQGLGGVVHSIIVGLSMQALLDPDSLPTGGQVTDALRVLG
ncbi:TetR/AcrR family transcriptional regulator [Kribbella solani]|uniref:TetR/AcrR family transcriptional regulator n=1 Tax=Kribbella solani TaxID=236067 RepID=UPI0029A98270|nr:TetR/AcrR family transcriptional regulator [Kribbella solani]MDX2973301.1 TetR/AcrR family transcriptional regulator [Kribbella solani]MDX3004493.1 TetR/AcrR family transcriptional regulator [Kribbella solani]